MGILNMSNDTNSAWDLPSQDKIDRFIAENSSSPDKLEMLRLGLQNSGLAMMRILSRDIFPVIDDSSRIANAKRGLVLDVETTGVNPMVDEITELAMVGFSYDDDGIISIDSVYDEFNQPLKGIIPANIEALTGITNEMVAGKTIDRGEVREIVAGSNMIIAHNAVFDRRMVEYNLFDCGFDSISWLCSMDQVDWLSRGRNGRSLEVLALSEGIVYGSHRADSDCLATAYILGSMDNNGRSAFTELLEAGRRATFCLIAENSPFDRKDLLKERGYYWSAGGGSDAFGHKGWYREIPDIPEVLTQEAEFLKDCIYKRDVVLPCYRINAMTRYSGRSCGPKEVFRTADFDTVPETERQCGGLFDHNV